MFIKLIAPILFFIEFIHRAHKAIFTSPLSSLGMLVITAHIIAKKRIIMLFKEIITVNSLERQPAIKGGSSLDT